MSGSKSKVPMVSTLIPSSRSESSSHSSNNILPLPLSTPTPTRTTRPSSPIPRSPISVSREHPLLAPRKDFDANAVVVQKPTTPIRVAATVEKPVTMSSYVEIVNSTSVENQLEAKKYTILDRILIDDNSSVTHYIKAFDPNGVIVYILMDGQGNLPTKSDDIKPLTLLKESRIRVSDKMAALTCSGTGISGVALVCNDEICMILRNNDGSTNEVSYQSPVNLIDTGDSAVPHIVVRLSEILADPDGVLIRCFEANDRMLRATFHLARENLNRTIEKTKLLQEAIDKFITNRNAAYDRLERDRSNFSNYTMKYYKQFISGSLDSQTETEYSLKSANAYARNKLFLDLISLTNTFNSEEDELEKICNTLITINNIVVEKHQCSASKVLSQEDILKL